MDNVVGVPMRASTDILRARLAKIKQNQARAIGKRGKALGRKSNTSSSAFARF